MFRVYHFNYWLDYRNSTCDVYKAYGYIKGECFCVRYGFNGYSKRGIIKVLKDLIRVEADKYFNKKEKL